MNLRKMTSTVVNAVENYKNTTRLKYIIVHNAPVIKEQTIDKVDFPKYLYAIKFVETIRGMAL